MASNSLLLFACVTFCVVQYISGAPSLVVSTTESSNGKESQNEASSNKIPTVPQIYQMNVVSNISNRFAHTTVTSKVKNIADKAQEADFSIVLPDNAFISGFIMEVDGKNYTAYVKEKEEAKKVYDQAVSSGLGAAHVAVSARDSNRFTVSVNIEPETKAAFYLTYEELLKRKDSRYELVVNIHPGQPVKDLTVEVVINESRKLTDLKAPPLRSGNEIDSDNAELDPRAVIEEISDTQAIVRFSPNLERQKQLAHLMKTDEDNGLSGQFVVQYDVERDPTGGEVLIRDGYFVHFFAPKDLKPLPKHIVFVLDTSGSMEGDRIRQLKEAMNKILEQLHEQDIFTLIEFNFNAKVWDLNNNAKSGWFPQKSSQWMWGNEQEHAEVESYTFPNAYPVNVDNIRKAKSAVNDFQADGGTNIYDSLQVALHLVKKEAASNTGDVRRQPLVMFLTDGEPTIGKDSTSEIIKEITKINSAGKTPIFSLSFGSGADKKFLQKLSLKNYGFSKHIYEASDASLQLQDFYNQISSPLLTDVTFKYESSVNEVTKTEFPVLYDGSEMVTSGSYDIVDRDLWGRVNPQIICTGTTGLTTLRPTVTTSVSNIERLWAYLTIKQLLEKKEVSDAEDDEINKKALDLALKYSFVTSVSSLVVVKPNATNEVDTEEATGSKPIPNYPIGLQYSQPIVHSGNMVGFPGLPGPPGPPAGPYSGYGNSVGSGFQSSFDYDDVADRTLTFHMIAPIFTPKTSTGDLLDDLLWINNILDSNGLLTLSTGNYKLGLNETISNNPTCTNTPIWPSGHCTLLKACPQVYSFLTSKDEYEKYFCILENEFAGVCCPEPNYG